MRALAERWERFLLPPSNPMLLTQRAMLETLGFCKSRRAVKYTKFQVALCCGGCIMQAGAGKPSTEESNFFSSTKPSLQCLEKVAQEVESRPF
jgi:hypothetical protein